jgi:biotin transport system substrate-specific component
MTSESNVLVDRFPLRRTIYMSVVSTLSFTLLTAAMARIEIRLPFTPVPLTGQTFAVLLSGAVLGWQRGFASQALYVSAGALGLPCFAGGAAGTAYLLGPTAGYLLSFPLAAGLLGWLVEQGASRKVWTLALALLAADLLILVSGTSWLRIVYGRSILNQWQLAFYPFLAGDVLKVCLVGITLPRILKHYREHDPVDC